MMTVCGSAPVAAKPSIIRVNIPAPPPTPLPVVQRLVRTVLAACISPAQTIAVDEYDTAQHPPVVHSRLALALEEERTQPLDLLVMQNTSLIPFFQSPNQTAKLASAGSDPCRPQRKLACSFRTNGRMVEMGEANNAVNG